MTPTQLLTATVATLTLGLTAPATALAEGNADAEEKVVYHINDSSNARAALRNVNNHISASPKARVVVVTHGPGIDFLLEGAQDKNGNPYDATVQELKSKGISFKVCANTLKSRNIDPKSVISEASIVPSGVAEIGKLQAQAGYVYLKP